MYSHQLGISEQLNGMHMPKFLLAALVKFRKKYFGEIQEEKGVGQKASHTHPQLLAEREKTANLNISSRFQAVEGWET